MKLHLKYLWIVLVACTLTACMNGGGDLAGKWQLRQYQYADGTSEKVDSVFYNFQKGSFSAICLLKDGGLTTFFGNYSLKGAEISIILLPESVNDKNYDTYFGWPVSGSCVSINMPTVHQRRWTVYSIIFKKEVFLPYVC